MAPLFRVPSLPLPSAPRRPRSSSQSLRLARSPSLSSAERADPVPAAPASPRAPTHAHAYAPDSPSPLNPAHAHGSVGPHVDDHDYVASAPYATREAYEAHEARLYEAYELKPPFARRAREYGTPDLAPEAPGRKVTFASEPNTVFAFTYPPSRASGDTGDAGLAGHAYDGLDRLDGLDGFEVPDGRERAWIAASIVALAVIATAAGLATVYDWVM
ncbi:hypothetical protein Q5752_006782 [Cryptotrichosporon argae]